MSDKRYFYRPLRFFSGMVLKCAGICTEQNQTWFTEACLKEDDPVYLPGCVIMDGYKGDRVHIGNHQEYTGE